MVKEMNMKDIKLTWVKQKFFCKHEWVIDEKISAITSVYGDYKVRRCVKCDKVERI
jgi:hypothetical protein